MLWILIVHKKATTSCIKKMVDYYSPIKEEKLMVAPNDENLRVKTAYWGDRGDQFKTINKNPFV